MKLIVRIFFYFFMFNGLVIGSFIWSLSLGVPSGLPIIIIGSIALVLFDCVTIIPVILKARGKLEN